MTLKAGPNMNELVDGALGEAHYPQLLHLWRAFDCFAQGVALSATTAAPPASPVDGNVYIVPPAATGAWAGHDNQVARWSAGRQDGGPDGWEYWTPHTGWRMHVLDDTAGGSTTGNVFIFRNTAWVVQLSGGGGSSLIPPNTQTTTPYTLVLADAGATVEMNLAGDNVVKVPANADVAFPIGTVIPVCQIGAGTTGIQAAAGVTIHCSHATMLMAAQWGTCSLRKRGTDDWALEGNLQ